MFSLKRCEHADCDKYSFNGGRWCYHHSPDKEQLKKAVIDAFLNGPAVRDISITAADFRSMDTSRGLKITGVNLAFCVFDKCTFTDTSVRSSYFDGCLFVNCSFQGMDVRYSAFATSTFISCSINDSTVIHTNFMGIETENCDFSGNDFYYSNFSLSHLVDTSLEDCNLKRTSFRSAQTKNTSFKYSNPEEAYLRKGD
ncbi:MAG: pentapeptide repeat-containing protein [Spirochaetes bacterium]|uniref:Pentapeptide repeat-containing protein n=1 Tax=Candidatus Ornithospirochaeta stercoripullorum TaxID=2840899 RepID=A0A9D9E1C8_9SPIO|nr:pentapeptide repeat-containing protein [Candidatus Ornithospirochaeta stercoripullorum]